MQILHFGSLCGPSTLQKKLAHHEPYFVAQYSYEKALCGELEQSKDINIEYQTIYQTQYFPHDSILIKPVDHDGPYRALWLINLPFLRELSYFCSTAIRVFRWAQRHKYEKEKCVLSSMHFLPVSLAVVVITNILSIKRIVTFTDLSSYTYHENRIKAMKFYKRVLMKPYIREVDRLQKSYDGYILFTENMNEVVNPHHRPYCVVEGIFNPEGIDLTPISHRESAIAHAGTLNAMVGILDLLDVHRHIQEPVKLWLMGQGDCVKAIQQRAKIDNRIIFFDYLPKPEVFEKLKRARLLLILRNPDDPYTRYSFPSKLFEYMASGTPVFITRLAGIPDAYYEYLYTVNGYDLPTIAHVIEQVIHQSDDVLEAKGFRARQFILEKKNANVQSMTVIQLLQQCLDDTSN